MRKAFGAPPPATGPTEMGAPDQPRGSVVLPVLVACVVAAALWFTTRGWHAPILDRHEFRQLQTALSAHWIREAGWKLDYETPLFGPPWSIPIEFPLYQGIVGRLSAWSGWSLESTGRGVSLLCFFATLPAVYGLAGLLGLARSRRLLVVAAVAATPTYLFYARGFLIETTALCAAVWFLWSVLRAFERTDGRFAALASVAGVLAALTKVTTFLTYLFPLAIGLLWLWRRPAGDGRLTLARVACAGVPVALALFAGAWWVAHADAVKLTNPFSGFLTSSYLTSWNWGTWTQRLAPGHWREFWSSVSQFVVGPPALGLVALVAGFVPPSARRVALAAAGCFLASTLVFWNLYFFHDYYYCANALLLAFGAGVLLAALWDDARRPLVLPLAVSALFFGSQFFTYYRGYGAFFRHEFPSPPALASLLRDATPDDGVLLIYGWDWNSTLPYYAGRRAVMVPVGRELDHPALESILARLPPRRIAAMVINGDALKKLPAFVSSKTEALGLTPAPIATSADGDVYLALDLLDAAKSSLARLTYAGVSTDFEGATTPPFAAGSPVDPATVALPFFTPTPRAARALFGLTPIVVAGQPALLANAPCELEFAPPPGARHVTATFGISDDAWRTSDSPTDGIGVEIFEVWPDGRRRVHFRRQLDPAREPADRGPQRAEFSAPAALTGTLVFRFTTGPHDNGAKDWSYWGEIRLR